MTSSSCVRARWTALAIAPIVALSLSCSASSNSDLGSNSGGGNSGTSGNSGNSGNGGFSGGLGGSTGVGGGFTPGPGGSGNGSDDGGCSATSTAAEQVVSYSPVDMHIMYDQSGSMNDDTPVGTRWDAIKAALIGFVNNPSSAGIGVGIDYFPQLVPGAPTTCWTDADCNTPAGNFGTCEGLNIFIACLCACSLADNCQITAYNSPEVPIDMLPQVAPAIVNSVNAHSPAGNTPTRPALEGAHQYAAGWAAAHPDRKTIVVLATDGDPTGCSANSVQDVANIAATGLAANPSVATFVIGVGSSLTSLNAIAAAGGSGQALIVDTSSGDPTQQFLDALNQIRDAVTVSTPVPCEWVIPPPPDGQMFDRNKVNLQFAAGGQAAQPIGAVPSAADCASVSGGWHYDDPANPTKVLVCPQTCSTIQAIPDARVDVSFGCETVMAIQ